MGKNDNGGKRKYSDQSVQLSPELGLTWPCSVCFAYSMLLDQEKEQNFFVLDLIFKFRQEVLLVMKFMDQHFKRMTFLVK